MERFKIEAIKQDEIHSLVGKYGATIALAYYQEQDDDEAIYYITNKYFNS